MIDSELSDYGKDWELLKTRLIILVFSLAVRLFPCNSPNASAQKRRQT